MATLLAIPGLTELEAMFEIVDPINIYKESLGFQTSIGTKILNDLQILSKNICVNINQEWPRGRGAEGVLMR